MVDTVVMDWVTGLSCCLLTVMVYPTVIPAASRFPPPPL